MGKPGKIFDFNSPWGCFGLTAWVFVLGTFAIYFFIAGLLPFTEYICNYRYNLAPMNAPVEAYPIMSFDSLAEFDDFIDPLPYRVKVKGHIVDRNGDVVTLRVNSYQLYEYQGTGGFNESKLRTNEFQKVYKEFEIKIPKKEAIPVFDENGSLYMFVTIVIIFGIAWPIMSFLMKKTNDISQNSVRYLAGTDSEYKTKNDTGGFTKK